ncbi:hypothetical protein NJ7G_2687 [Natrinema sp. J7-2]|nr:hypothetical protein NJ7G_2687 [Natrinema sp. J7-2]
MRLLERDGHDPASRHLTWLAVDNGSHAGRWCDTGSAFSMLTKRTVESP